MCEGSSDAADAAECVRCSYRRSMRTATSNDLCRHGAAQCCSDPLCTQQPYTSAHAVANALKSENAEPACAEQTAKHQQHRHPGHICRVGCPKFGGPSSMLADIGKTHQVHVGLKPSRLACCWPGSQYRDIPLYWLDKTSGLSTKVFDVSGAPSPEAKRSALRALMESNAGFVDFQTLAQAVAAPVWKGDHGEAKACFWCSQTSTRIKWPMCGVGVQHIICLSSRRLICRLLNQQSITAKHSAV